MSVSVSLALSRAREHTHTHTDVNCCCVTLGRATRAACRRTKRYFPYAFNPLMVYVRVYCFLLGSMVHVVVQVSVLRGMQENEAVQPQSYTQHSTTQHSTLNAQHLPLDTQRSSLPNTRHQTPTPYTTHPSTLLPTPSDGYIRHGAM